MSRFLPTTLLALLTLAACKKAPVPQTAATGNQRPSILLITLDTTRADSIGPEAKGVETPAFNALAARGRRFRRAYATTPQTLPSHASIMTGLYPAGHGVHENGRHLGTSHPVLAEALQRAGYRTAAFVSAFAVARRFGLARGFETYNDDFGAANVQRTAAETTDAALAYIGQQSAQPLFLWVHYYDPHYPYTPPEPFRTRYAKEPYLGEVASMDEQAGRLVEAFERSAPGPKALVVVGDHGEGLGDHGEAQHGNLLYEATMRVPFVLMGPGLTPGVTDTPVSTREIFYTVLGWAGLGATHSLERPDQDPLVGEAMKPFLDYGWQPQVMAVEGRLKAILAGTLEVYDVVADPGETRNLAAEAGLSRSMRATLRDYPLPSPQAPEQATSDLDEEERRKLASLGYVAATARPVVRKDAPRPAEMAHLFLILDKASGLFVREQYAEAIPLLRQIQAADPYNLDAALRMATAHSSLGQDAEALRAFRKAEAIAPESRDVRTYLALHLARGRQWQQAVPMLERIVSDEPDRVPALEALAMLRERQGRIDDAVTLRRRLYVLRAPSAAELVRLGQMEMGLGQTAAAIASLERARAMQGAAFRQHLELGVLYLAAGRLADARDALDRVPPTPMALFKRAQVSVLLHEPDAPARIERARQNADATTAPLIERESLFRK